MGYPSFAAVLEKHLKRRGWSLREFAREAGVPPSLVSRTMHGERAVPTGRVEEWADLLDLRGQERGEFIDAAMWTAIPERVRPWVEAKLGARR